MFCKEKNILALPLLALLSLGASDVRAQGVVTLADDAAQEDAALNSDIPDEISLFSEEEPIDELGSAALPPAPKTPAQPQENAAPVQKPSPETSAGQPAPVPSQNTPGMPAVADTPLFPAADVPEIPVESNKLISQPSAGIGALDSRTETPISVPDDKIFSQMSDLEKQTTLLNLELRREKVRNEIEALKNQRKQAYQQEIEKEEAKRKAQIEWEKEQEQKVIQEQQKLRELDIKFEQLRQEKLLNEYKNYMLEENQKWIAANADFYKQIADSKKDREELIKTTQERFSQLANTIKGAINKVQDVKAGYEREIGELQNQVSILKARIEVQEKEMEKQNPFADASQQAAAAAAAQQEEVEVVEPELKLNNMYAVMEIRGQGGELIAKLINQDGQPFYVKKGTTLQSGHIIDDITSTYVRADKNGVKDYLYFAAGGILPFEVGNSEVTSTLKDELAAAEAAQNTPQRSFVASDTVPGMGRDMIVR